MSQQTFVYRGVTYSNAVNQPLTSEQKKSQGRVYRGVGMVKSPVIKLTLRDHVYRGAHYMAAC